MAQHTEDATSASLYHRYLESPNASTFHKYAYSTWFADVDTSIKLTRMAIDMAQEEGDLRTQTQALLDLGRMMIDRSALDSCEYYFAQSIALAERCDFYNLLGYALNNRAHMRFTYANDVNGAIDDVNRSLAAFEID
ncbi:MAG: hypothetical protein AAFR14_09195, partial [Bacteroidota bacterium]